MATTILYGKFKRDEQGPIGIGTLIVFIAMVLVAAIAAAVVLDTAGRLKQEAQVTGAQAREDVSGGIRILRVEGYDIGTNNDFDEINMLVVLCAGASPIAWEDMSVYILVEDRSPTSDDDGDGIADEDFVIHADFQDGSLPDTSVFDVTEVVGNGDMTISRGETWYIDLQLDNDAGGIDAPSSWEWAGVNPWAGGANAGAAAIEPNCAVTIRLLYGGAPVISEEFVTPSSYDGDTYIQLV